jgi:hypothetical protein
MSNRQARRRRAEAVRNGDIFHKAARQEMGRAKAEEVARHNAAEAEERNRYRDAHERARGAPPSGGDVVTEAPPPLRRTSPHLTRLQLIALAMAAAEGERR